MSMQPRILLLGLLVGLGACSVLPPAESPDVYRLPAVATVAASNAAIPTISLRVDTPQAGPTLDTTRIAVAPASDIITAYQGARWSDRAPRLLRDRLIDGLRASGRYVAVGSDEASLPADIELAGDLRAFQAEYEDGRPVVAIIYDAQLVQLGSRSVLASQRFEIRRPVSGTAVPQVVTAFGEAADQLTIEVADWVATVPRDKR